MAKTDRKDLIDVWVITCAGTWLFASRSSSEPPIYPVDVS
jgi:hypothetical protein